MEAGTGGDETTHFEKRLLAQYGTEGGDLTRTRTGNILPPSSCLSRYNSTRFSSEDVSQILPFLAGKKLNIAGFDEETAQVRLETVMVLS